ncbi:MAG: hypothetical protein U1E17_09500 [Geminicoccaceae bacterium]
MRTRPAASTSSSGRRSRALPHDAATARLLAARGTLQCESGVIHLIVERPFDLTLPCAACATMRTI